MSARLAEIMRRILGGEDPDAVLADMRARDAEREAELQRQIEHVERELALAQAELEAERARAEGRLQ
jgi:hypothetical protein